MVTAVVPGKMFALVLLAGEARGKGIGWSVRHRVASLRRRHGNRITTTTAVAELFHGTVNNKTLPGTMLLQSLVLFTGDPAE
jgi:hypothetical protein